MKFKLICIIFFSFLFCYIKAQESPGEEIVRLSEIYYEKLNKFYIDVRVKSKASIAEDTAIGIYKCYIDRTRGVMVFLLSENEGILIYNQRQYFIAPLHEKFEMIKKNKEKYSIYNTRYNSYPFVDPGFAFDIFKNNKVAYQKKEASILLTLANHVYEFNSIDNSVQRIIQMEYDTRNKGLFFEETRFGEILLNDTLVDSRVNSTLSMIKTSGRIDNLGEKNLRPEKIDISLLNDTSIRILNIGQQSLKSKMIIFDFFYEGCLPCLKAHPKMNEIYKNKDSSSIVVGIDPKLMDTLNISSYVLRHGIKYPVIYGRVATRIAEELKIRSYPTFVVIDQNGNVKEFKEGYSESFFRKYNKSLKKAN